VGSCSSAATALNGICSNVDIADRRPHSHKPYFPSLYFSNFLGWVRPTLTVQAPSAGIGASIATPSGAELLINSSTGINPDPSDTSRMFVQYADPSAASEPDNIFANGYSPDFNDSSESPALPQKQLVVGPAPRGERPTDENSILRSFAFSDYSDRLLAAPFPNRSAVFSQPTQEHSDDAPVIRHLEHAAAGTATSSAI
jgi:hypothetical protein